MDGMHYDRIFESLMQVYFDFLTTSESTGVIGCDYWRQTWNTKDLPERKSET